MLVYQRVKHIKHDQSSSKIEAMFFHARMYVTSSALFLGPPGENRVCRGANPNDNKPEYYTVLQGIGTLQLCKAQCASTVARQGLAKDQIIGIRKVIQQSASARFVSTRMKKLR